MSNAPVPYVYGETGPRNTRRVISYSAAGEPSYRGLVCNRFNQPELIMEARDVASVRIDVSDMLDASVGERVEEVSLNKTGCQADINKYSSDGVLITIWGVQGCVAEIVAELRFSSRETLTVRMYARLPLKEGENSRSSQAPFQRGVV